MSILTCTAASHGLSKGLSQISPAYLSFLYPSTSRFIHNHVIHSNNSNSSSSGQSQSHFPQSHQSSSSSSNESNQRHFSTSISSFKPTQTPPTHSSTQSSSSTSTHSSPPITLPQSSSSKNDLFYSHNQQQHQSNQHRTSTSSSLSSNSSSAIPSDEACASLSPSSPAAPRSQSTRTASSSSASGAQPATSAPTQNVESAIVSEQGKAPPPGPINSANKPKARPAASRGTKFTGKKAAITLTPEAVVRLQSLLTSPTGPKLIRIGVRNKGCAGMAYHLEYVKPEEAGKFDERVKQDGVEVLVDSKALFSIIGSEMDWKEDRLSAKFVFNNPNIKEACGCGESFLT